MTKEQVSFLVDAIPVHIATMQFKKFSAHHGQNLCAFMRDHLTPNQRFSIWNKVVLLQTAEGNYDLKLQKWFHEHCGKLLIETVESTEELCPACNAAHPLKQKCTPVKI